ncbi:MAG: flagellar M-ring protein FliF [Firmicutes bacterium]|nr:flagellar M-ring protein FliF [Bacillota bacterium]
MTPTKILAQVIETWKKMSLAAKAVVSGAGVLVLVGLIVLVATSSRGPRMEPLFTGLDPRDASDMVARLEKDKVPYRLDAGGTAILVAAHDVHRLRLVLAADGLPRGGTVGFELMDKTRIGATDFDRRVNYVRAVQGELTRTITQIDGVEAARVHIVLPEQSLFVSKARPATAAVLVKVRPMMELDKLQVRGIANLVSRSVEGLRPEDVTIVDYKGKVLSSEYGLDQTSADKQAGSFMEVKMAFQKDLERSVQTLLETALGQGNVVARVNADVSFDQTTVSRSLFTPADNNEGIARSIKQLQEVFQGTGGGAGGVPGVPSNVPGYSGATVQPGNSSYQRTETTKNVEINEVRENTVVAPGTVKRLSVAVIVNRDLTPAEKGAIENTVAAAVGIDPKRQDTITVTGMLFDTTLVDQLKKDMEKPAGVKIPKYAYAGAAALALAIVAGTVFVILRRRRALEPQSIAAEALEAVVAESKEPTPASRAKEHIEKLVRQNPEGVAQLLKTWLAEAR